MASPLFEQDEIDAVLAADKVIEHDDLQRKRKPSRDPATRAFRVPVRCASIKNVELHMEVSVDTTGFHYLLLVRFSDRVSQAIVRYDVHDGVHMNPDWHNPEIIRPRQAHRHVYSRRAVMEDKRWDLCADSVGPNIRSMEHLQSCFLQELSISIESSSRQGLLGYNA